MGVTTSEERSFGIGNAPFADSPAPPTLSFIAVPEAPASA